MNDLPALARSTIRKVVRRLNTRFRLPDSRRPDGLPEGLIAQAVDARRQRHAHAKALASTSGRVDWPPVYADPFPELSGVVPEVGPENLTTDLLGGAVAHHGLLLIRGLFSAEQVAEARAVQDKVKAASSTGEPDSSGWYIPFKGHTRNEVLLRKRAESNGGNWLADSPLGFSRVLDHLSNTGVIEMLAEHFQERPALSLQKTVMRSMQPEPRITGWHQDGSFLNSDVRTMNLWIALSPCGGSHPASGIELIPRRLEEIITIAPSLDGTAVSFEAVEELQKTHPSVIPQFEAGDALIFDHHLLHRTSLEPGLSEVRYALECWFFAPSHTNDSYNPFLV